MTPVGWPTYFVEDYVNVPLAFQAQLLSFVTEGVFVEFPELTVATIEGGFVGSAVDVAVRQGLEGPAT